MAKKKKEEEKKPAKKAPEKKAKLWKCPHCDTVYKPDMEVAKANHLARHANK